MLLAPELAVYLTRITDLPFREAVYWKRIVAAVRGNDGSGRSVLDDELRTLLSRRDSRKRLRVYFGNEFCQERIPAPRELEASCRALREVGFPLTFVTPPVNDEGAEILVDRLTALQNWMPGSEVVVNDWGVLRLLHQSFPSLTPVLGRLLTKFLRDPRITARYRPEGHLDAPSHLKQSSLGIPAYRRLLRGFGVKRTELDNLYQGIEVDFQASRFLPSLYIPFGYVTTGRICLLGNLHLQRNEKFASPKSTCPRPCLRVGIDLTDASAPGDAGAAAFKQAGNTIFYRQSKALVRRGLAWARQQGARVVYQPEIPF